VNLDDWKPVTMDTLVKESIQQQFNLCFLLLLYRVIFVKINIFSEKMNVFNYLKYS